MVPVTTKAKLKVMRKPSRQDKMDSVHAMAMVRRAEAQPQMAVRQRSASVGRTIPCRESLAATTRESSTRTKSLPAETLTSRSPGFSQGHSDALRSFLLSAKCLTDEPAAFQLRCKQPGTDGKLARKVVIVVGGKCRLFKLNQIIAECFDAGCEEFSYNHMQGSTVLGSRFLVSRPLSPGSCDKAIVCSSQTAKHVGSPDAFVNDRNYSVAQLFRGKSTRHALERAPSEAAQHVEFVSPLLDSEVLVTLDGIMLDRYDSHNLFEKKRRHSNGSRPLPRIVRSSFLSVAEIEAKNILMQGSREGPDYLLKISTPWSAIHETSRRAQRKPLFRKDGRDYDLHDLCYVSGDEETDTDVDC